MNGDDLVPTLFRVTSQRHVTAGALAAHWLPDPIAGNVVKGAQSRRA